MPDYTTSSKSILRDLLAAGPVRGARLKLLFAHAFEAREGVPYEDAFAQFTRFSELLNRHLDVLHIERPFGPGDITVRLREASPDTAVAARQGAQSSPAAFMRPELWHAFTNPDPRRRRFINRLTGEIVHFLDDSDTEPNPRFAERVHKDVSFVELRAIAADQQKAWMQEFIASDALPEVRRKVVAPILGLPYSSQMNTLLMGGLGEHAEAWRAFRAKRVFEFVREWCSENGLVVDDVLRPRGAPVPSAAEAVATTLDQQLNSELTPHRPPDERELRRSLRATLDQMTDEELGRVLLPASAVLRIHSRRTQ